MGIWYYQRGFNKGERVKLAQNIIIANHQRPHGGQETRTLQMYDQGVVFEEPFTQLFGSVQYYTLVMDGYPDDILYNVPEHCIMQVL